MIKKLFRSQVDASTIRKARLKREMRAKKRARLLQFRGKRRFIGTVVDINDWLCEFIEPQRGKVAP